MSYNGIGLQTAKGSSTNGFIQKNYTKVRESSYSRRLKLKKEEEKRRNKQIIEDLSNVKDKELQKHEEKRKIELKISEYRDSLEDLGELDDDEIEQKCKEFRKALLRPQEILSSYIKREDREEKEGTKSSEGI